MLFGIGCLWTSIHISLAYSSKYCCTVDSFCRSKLSKTIVLGGACEHGCEIVPAMCRNIQIKVEIEIIRLAINHRLQVGG